MMAHNLHVLVVTSSGILLVGGNVYFGTSGYWDICITNCVTSSNLWSLCVKGNSDLATWLNLLGLAGVINDRLVVLVGTMGEVHAHDVETSLSELVNCLDRVRLWTNCADDRGTSVVLCWLELSVQSTEPFDFGPGGQVLESGSHCLE